MKSLTGSILFLFLVPPIIAGCQHHQDEEKSEAFASELALVDSLMLEQQEAWNQYNLESYMQSYHNSDSLLFIGTRGMSYGWKTTLSNYQKSYSTPEEMGRLLFENKKMEQINKNAIWVAGRWNLFRKTDTLQGSYLLVWKKINGQWKIVADHSS